MPGLGLKPTNRRSATVDAGAPDLNSAGIVGGQVNFLQSWKRIPLNRQS
jgi:hypothetical protein